MVKKVLNGRLIAMQRLKIALLLKAISSLQFQKFSSNDKINKLNLTRDVTDHFLSDTAKE